MNQKEVIQLINDYWKFDNDQDNLSTWHDKQDLISEIEKLNLSGVSHFADKEEPIGKFIIDNAKGTETQNGVYYHYSDVCALLNKQKEQLNLSGVVGQSEQLCTCKNPKINDMRWSCDKCDKDFDNRYKVSCVGSSKN